MNNDMDNRFMNRALELAKEGMNQGHGGPFGCVIVKNGEIIAEGNNSVLSENDPTAHAEIVAIRQATKALGTFQLDGCELYTSCEPCPMCLGAIYWARPERVFYAATRNDAAKAGFDVEFIYNELNLDPAKRSIQMVNVGREDALPAFRSWLNKENKRVYLQALFRTASNVTIYLFILISILECASFLVFFNPII